MDEFADTERVRRGLASGLWVGAIALVVAGTVYVFRSVDDAIAQQALIVAHLGRAANLGRRFHLPSLTPEVVLALATGAFVTLGMWAIWKHRDGVAFGALVLGGIGAGSLYAGAAVSGVQIETCRNVDPCGFGLDRAQSYLHTGEALFVLVAVLCLFSSLWFLGRVIERRSSDGTSVRGRRFIARL